MHTQQVILVDGNDDMVGTMEKMQAHREGLLHRAFSVFVFNSSHEMLLQQRALEKYHSAGLWSNACCSHPFPGEETQAAAMRRLKEELGFETPLEKIFDFVYRAEFDNGLVENEFDHVFVGRFDGPLQINANEVQAYEFKRIELIREELKNTPEKYTAWFHIAFPRLETHFLS